MKNKNRSSLTFKLSINVLLMSLTIGIFISYFGYRIYYKEMINHYYNLGETLINTSSKLVDWDKIDYYLETLDKDEQYNEVMEELRILNAASDAEYLYVLVPKDNGAVYVFDTDESKERCELGYYWEWYEDFVSYEDELNRGEAVGPILTDEDYGWLLSIYLPFNDTNGEFAGYLGVDYSVDHMMNQLWSFMYRLITAAILISIFLAVVSFILFSKIVIKPINKLANAANAFVVGDSEYTNSIEQLSIRSNDELGELEDALKAMDQRIKEYITSLKIVTHKAEIDSMTQLYNRGSFEKKVNQTLMEKNDVNSIFFIIDIDSFKSVNDNYGHDIGDKVIKDFSSILRFHIRHDAIVGRLGGDEFGIFVQGDWPQEAIEKEASDLLEEFSNISRFYDFNISASMGVCIGNGKNMDFHKLYKTADEALYQVKDSGKSNYVFKTYKEKNK